MAPTHLRRRACRGGLRADDWQGVEEVAKGRSSGCAGFLPYTTGVLTAHFRRRPR